MLTKIVGDLFEVPDLQGLAHGVNTEGKMCSGIAVTFRDKYPEMHDEYLNVCKNEGVTLGGQVFVWKDSKTNQWIYNIFSQLEAGPKAKLGLLEEALWHMTRHARFYGVTRIGLPYIGSGVGGLDVEDTMKLFERVLGPSSVEFVLVEFVRPKPVVIEPVMTFEVLAAFEKALRQHSLVWRINALKPNEVIQAWCSCGDRVLDYPTHIREVLEPVEEA